MKFRQKIGIVIPIYNEERRLDQLCSQLKNYVQLSQETEFFFIFVNDGSTDNSGAILEGKFSDLKNSSVLSYVPNRGKGHAIRFGMDYFIRDMKVQYIGVMDADLATPLYHLEFVAKTLEQSAAHFLIGNRKINNVIHHNHFRNLASLIFNTLTKLCLSQRYQDTQAGFKFYSTSFADIVVKNARIDRFAFDVEHLLISEFLLLRPIEYQIPDWTNREFSTVRVFRDGARMFWDLLKLRLVDSFKLKWALKTHEHKA